MNSRLSKILTILTCCSILIAWLIPLHFRPWTTVYNDFAAFVALLFAGLLILRNPIQVPAIVGLVGLIAAIPLLQWQFGIIFFFGDAFIVFSYLIGLACAILVGYNLSSNSISRNNTYLIFTAVIIFASVISTWICIRQWLGLQPDVNSFFEARIPFGSGKRPYGNLGQPNLLATLLCIGIASVFYLFEKRHLTAFGSSLLAAFLIFGLSLTQSRTPWLGALFLLIWCCWKGNYIRQRTPWLSLFGLIAFYAACVISLPKLTEVLLHHDIDLLSRATATTRLPMWHQFWLALVDGPLWGYGWNQGALAQTQLSILEKFSRVDQSISSHNILLDLLIWNGPILGGIIIALAAIWLCRLALHARSLESSFALLAVGFVLIHSMLEYPLLYAYLLLPVGFLLGAANREKHQSSEHQNSKPRRHLSPVVFAGLLLIAALLMVRIMQEYKYFNNDHSVLLNTELQTHFTPKSTGVADHTFFLTQLNERLRMDVTDPSTNMTAEQLEWMRQVTHVYSTPIHLYTYAAALALNDQPQLAAQECQYLKIYFGQEAYEAAIEQINALQRQR